MADTEPTVFLEAGEVKYLRFTVALPTDPPVTEVDVSIDGGVTWVPGTVNTAGTSVSLLVAHPGTANPPAEATVATRGWWKLKLRVIDTPEALIERFGTLRVL